MKTATIKNAIVEIVNEQTIAKDNLMKEMAEAIISALGTFVAIEKGIITEASNPITGEGLKEIAKGEKETLRAIFDKYVEATK